MPADSAQSSSKQKANEKANASQITLKKPVALIKREMTFDWKNIVIKSGKTVGSFFVKGIDGAALSAGDLLNDIGLTQQKEELAWLLVCQAMTNNFLNIIDESKNLFSPAPSTDDKTHLGQQLSQMLEGENYLLDNNFFDQPENAAVVSDFLPIFDGWLISQNLDTAQTQGLINRFKANLPLNLHNQWAANGELFSIITTALNTPFSKAEQKQQQWRNYHLWLKTQINEPMFGEAFSLNEVYVKPNAYYVIEHEGKEIEVELHNELTDWVQNFKANDAFRVISGLPGAGKSSMAKMLAVEWANNLDISTVFIPLQHFRLGGNVHAAISDFATRDKYLPDDILSQQRVIFIFDGLDELAELGKQTLDSAKDFVMQLIGEIRLNNSQECQQQVLLTGRDISTGKITSHFSEPKQNYHLQGFNEQQQDLWWQQYGKASGKNYPQMPKALKIKRLKEVVSQPLLSYLVALSYVRGKISFNQHTSLNQIYQDLLDSVYEREKHKNISNVAQELNKSQFSRILEEVALAVWHGGTGRTATVAAIEKQCATSGLTKNLKAFEQGAEAGVTKLLTAFYFRQTSQQISQQSSNDKTFEFTHKSFGEYLTAKRLVRLVKRLTTKLASDYDDPEDRWTAPQALFEWITVAGPTAIDGYLHTFIKDEMQLAGKEQCKLWQQHLLTLLNYSINYGLPMEKVAGLSYPQMSKHARHADEALLVCLNACALVTQQLSKIKGKDNTYFGTWFKRLQSQRREHFMSIAYDCLSYLDLTHASLIVQDLYGANLSHSTLQNANLYSSTPVFANLTNADLISANLTNADLIGTDLTRADLTNAHLTNADLTDAVLSNANLTYADLTHANLTDANLKRAKVNFFHHDKSMFSDKQLKQIIVVED